MTMIARLEFWREKGLLSPDQEQYLAKLARDEPYSLSLELSVLLYAGVLAFLAGLGWTISTWSQQLGTALILAGLSILLVTSLWYCFSRSAAWSPKQISTPNHYFDYVVYFSSLIWCIELAYLESRFKMLSGQWETCLLATAVLFFLLAYRFDNRFVLSLALSTLAGWFGLTVARWPTFQDGAYRQYALLFCLVVGIGGFALQRLKIKPHFFVTYLHVVANMLFWTILSGIFNNPHYSLWFLALLLAGSAALGWGLQQRHFSFVAYASIYGYFGISSVVLRSVRDPVAAALYFVVTATVITIVLVQVARRFEREQ